MKLLSVGTTGRIAVFAVTAAVTTTACGPSPPGELASPNQVEDSAGVVIVENARSSVRFAPGLGGQPGAQPVDRDRGGHR